MGLYNFNVDLGEPQGYGEIANTYMTDTQQRHTPIAINYDESKDIQLARRLSREMINVSGAELKLYVRTDNSDYDHVWDVDPDPTYWNCILVKGFFKPQPIEAQLVEWGLDTINKTEVVFSYHDILELVGDRMIRPGDVLQLPYNSLNIRPKNYRVLNSTPSGNFRYNWLYLTCQTETLTADITVRVEDDVQMDVPEQTGGVYRETL